MPETFNTKDEFMAWIFPQLGKYNREDLSDSSNLKLHLLHLFISTRPHDMRLTPVGVSALKDMFQYDSIPIAAPRTGFQLLGLAKLMTSPWYIDFKEVTCFNIRTHLEWQLYSYDLDKWLAFRNTA